MTEFRDDITFLLGALALFFLTVGAAIGAVVTWLVCRG